MRPKSMATGGVVLDGSMERSSMGVEASVMRASVRSGSISETAPTKVVLPTPKPPATTILTERAPGLVVASVVVWSESTKAISYSFEDGQVAAGGEAGAGVGGVGVGDVDELFGFEVGDQDAGDAEGDADDGGDFGDRSGGAAHPQDAFAFWFGVDVVGAAGGGGRDEGLPD